MLNYIIDRFASRSAAATKKRLEQYARKLQLQKARKALKGE